MSNTERSSVMRSSLLPGSRLARCAPGAVLAACGLVVITACSGQDSDPSGNGGVATLRFVEDLRLDAEAEDFSIVGDVVVDVAGRIAVALHPELETRIYDADGRRIAATGRRGQGPGEFGLLQLLTWVGDTIVAYDQSLRRITRFTATGALVGTHSVSDSYAVQAFGRDPAAGSFGYFQPVVSAPDGSFLGIATRITFDGSGTPVLSSGLVVAWSEERGGHLLLALPEAEASGRHIVINGLRRSVPFLMPEITAYARDGSRFAVATADQDARDPSFTVTSIGADGDTIFDRSYPVRGIPVSSETFDSAFVAIGRPAPAQAEVDGSRFQALARPLIPPIHPPVVFLHPARDGTTWVTLRADQEGNREVMVLGAEGTPLGTGPIPPRSRVREATASHVWMTETDEVGLVSVVRYRIERDR